MEKKQATSSDLAGSYIEYILLKIRLYNVDSK